MPEDYSNNTITFSMEDVREADMKRILLTVYDALKEKGYNPISQIVGYILSEDPTYITTHNNARSLIQSLSTLMDSAFEKVESLDTLLSDGKVQSENTLAVATYYKDTIIPAMTALRAVVDEMEVNTAADFWPYPSYGDLMFRV